MGFPSHIYRPILPAWNVPSTCLPIEQELVEQCWLLLLALASNQQDVDVSGRFVGLHQGTFFNGFIIFFLEDQSESEFPARLISRTT